MNKKKIGLIGLGTVGSAFLKEFQKNISFIKKNLELDIQLAKACDLNPKSKKFISSRNIKFTKNARDIINDPDIDIVVELIGGIKPAKDYILGALHSGKDVITANKALLASFGREIFEVAYRAGKTIGFEAAVAGGVPIVKSVSEALRFGEIKEIYGILNGTTNFILSEMTSKGISYSQSLKDARRRGIAEKDASLDIKGLDSLHKISLLCFLCFGKFPELKNILTEGIERISIQDIRYAKELGFSIKLLAIARKEKDIELRVHPALVSNSHSLAKTEGVFNSIFVNTSAAGDFLFSGLGAGGSATALSVLSDVITACGRKRFYALRESKQKAVFKKSKDIISRYYLRFSALDRPGVLAKISKVLSEYKISIASVTQKEPSKSKKRLKFVPIVMLTHVAKEESINKALAKIDSLSIIKDKTQYIRIVKL